jgi:hypothetical protein
VPRLGLSNGILHRLAGDGLARSSFRGNLGPSGRSRLGRASDLQDREHLIPVVGGPLDRRPDPYLLPSSPQPARPVRSGDEANHLRSPNVLSKSGGTTINRPEQAIAATHHDLGRGLWTLASIASTAFWFSSLAVLNGIINSFGGLSTEAMYGRQARRARLIEEARGIAT